jgi:hypothetical protein
MNNDKTAFATLAAAIALLTACSGPALTAEPGTNTPSESSPVTPPR